MKARQVSYFVKRVFTENGLRYLIHKNGSAPFICRREGRFFVAGGAYHRTLRDAIIYCVYGV